MNHNYISCLEFGFQSGNLQEFQNLTFPTICAQEFSAGTKLQQLALQRDTLGRLQCVVYKVDYEQSPIFPQGQQGERSANVRGNHPTQEKATRGPCLLFLHGVIFTRLRFARPTIPEEKWGTTRSLYIKLNSQSALKKDIGL